LKTLKNFSTKFERAEFKNRPAKLNSKAMLLDILNGERECSDTQKGREST